MVDWKWNGWIMKILVRDIVFNFGIVVLWWAYIEFYCRRYIKTLRFNPKYPSYEELKREIPYSLSTVLI